MPRAISSKSSANNPAGCLIPFFSIFAIVGSWAFVAQFAIPGARVLAARSWTPTPCHIKSSAVGSRNSGDDLSFYPDVWYSYSAGAQNYDSTRFSFFRQNFNTTGEAQSLINALPTGASATCYVNPNDPTQAVLDRGFARGAWANLMSLLVFAVGAGGISWQVISLRAARRNASIGRKSWQPKTRIQIRNQTPIQSAARGASTPDEIVLKPTAAPGVQACGLWFFSIFWNGITGVFLWELVFGMHGWNIMRVFLGVFLIPFVLLGVLMILAAFSSIGALFIARPIVTASTPEIPLGGEFVVRWKTGRGLVSPRKLSLQLEAREEAQNTQDSENISTTKNVFYTREISSDGALEGQSTLSIPAHLMHSLDAPRNKIVWCLKVKGEVSRWSDFEDEYRIIVTPQSQAQMQPSGAGA